MSEDIKLETIIEEKKPCPHIMTSGDRQNLPCGKIPKKGIFCYEHGERKLKDKAKRLKSKLKVSEPNDSNNILIEPLLNTSSNIDVVPLLDTGSNNINLPPVPPVDLKNYAENMQNKQIEIQEKELKQEMDTKAKNQSLEMKIQADYARFNYLNVILPSSSRGDTSAEEWSIRMTIAINKHRADFILSLGIQACAGFVEQLGLSVGLRINGFADELSSSSDILNDLREVLDKYAPVAAAIEQLTPEKKLLMHIAGIGYKLHVKNSSTKITPIPMNQP